MAPAKVSHSGDNDLSVYGTIYSASTILMFQVNHWHPIVHNVLDQL